MRKDKPTVEQNSERRIWVRRDELDRLKELFQQELQDCISALIPFERVLPLLAKPEITRIVWCRAARQEFKRWGIRVGIRNNQQAYKVQISDMAIFQKEMMGIGIQDQKYDCWPDAEPELDELIPQSDPTYVLPDWSAHLLQSLDNREHVLLTGPTGSGKSSLIRELCAIHHKRFMRVNLNGETSVADIIGGWRVQGREMIFQHGPIPQAMKLGAVLCLDEIDAAIPQVLFVLQPIMEERGSLLIPETGERIMPHPDFRVAATANTCGHGDDSGLYAGTNILNESFMDRFHCVYAVDYLSAIDEAFLLVCKVRGIDLNFAERLVKVAADLRQALKDGVIYSTCSTRKLIAWANKTVQIGCPKKAAVYTVLNKLSQDDQRVVQEVLQRHGF